MKLGPFRFFEKRVIGESLDPYLIRYIVFRCESFGFYFHKFCRSDYDRALHDHPWPFVSILLSGGYFEVHDQTLDREQERFWRPRWSVLLRPAEWRHRVQLHHEQPVWTLMIVGRKCRRWGFFLPTGWCH